MNTERLTLANDSTPPRFAQSFWGKDDAGYSALATRMRHAKLTCQEVLGMFQARAALEEEYGKKLIKLSKSPLGKDELGSLRDSLNVVRYEIEATGKSHVELAGKMRDQLELALADFNNSQKEKRKLHQTAIDRSFRNKQLYLQQLVKAKDKYDAECIRTRGLSVAKMNLVGKDLDKVTLKMEKTELASRAADIEYQASIRQLTEINEKWISDWRSACDKFQLLEEQRIDYLRTTLWNYANIISSACVADDESCERIRSSLELCDVNQNLQSFIEECATGEDVPDITTYLNPKSSEGSDSTVDNTITPRASMQEIRVRTVCGPHQPIINNNDSGASSRPPPSHSIDHGADTGINPGSHVEVALAVGNNVFKLDPQTAALMDQDDSAIKPPAENNSTRQFTRDRSPSISTDNSLGISLDASGTVKENRFPHWQSQAPLQPSSASFPTTQPTLGILHPQYQNTVNNTSINRLTSTAAQGCNQTMSAQSDAPWPNTHGMDATLQNRKANSSYSGSSAPIQHQTSYHEYGGATEQSHTQAGTQSTHDGRRILFYVRVMYDYEATIPEELSLKEGNIIAVLHTRDDGWWEGDLIDDNRNHMRGLFPSNFTEPTE
ncbi:Proline-serine-threonine phosphatase-interacting protein 2 [Lobosporangium transversale]|uniref:SH3 domain-containing protein n=1 Tax=Lobosporangium transversale TaxID=64571 RepID=A0A1Y2GL29_9FUNG|nr:hypothetical protein BCR41DRAFT_387494 [Lobosporangium transversale]KAF9918543.1 Proline-serine-threonine phosphatase-interacting protein 2 [Lobosporangium transversale]ORZ12583.1 hypothetical protein BCR41DRAFT_387494 [Lobosporangium transversale]|eukprot:XP_021880202.1 hypothetical protein BCR41DRAFT_387494 [Lobosporangium transversale]